MLGTNSTKKKLWISVAKLLRSRFTAAGSFFGKRMINTAVLEAKQRKAFGTLKLNLVRGLNFLFAFWLKLSYLLHYINQKRAGDWTQVHVFDSIQLLENTLKCGIKGNIFPFCLISNQLFRSDFQNKFSIDGYNACRLYREVEIF